jgi:photosystem II stability/assembly factor-like uncharacterized protein
VAAEEVGEVVQRRVAGLLFLVALLGGGCSGSPPAITFDSTIAPPATTTLPGATTASAPVGDSSAGPTSSLAPVAAGRKWVDATANLTGMESYCGNLSFVSARPDRDQVLAGVAGQGLFSNDPGSSEWIPFGRGAGSASLNHRTSSIVYDPADPRRFWESGYYGLGAPPDTSAASVNRTDNDGETFVGLGTVPGADLVSVDFTDPQRQTLLAGIRGQPQVFGSADGGATWSDISAGLPTDLGEASLPHVLDASTYLLGTHKGDKGAAASPGIWRTVDAGATWTRVFDQGVAGPPLASADGNLYWVLDAGGVISSADGGTSWTLLPGVGPAGGGQFGDARRARIIEVPDGTWVSMSDDFVVVSRDRGASWRGVGPELPFDFAGFTYSASRNSVYAWQNYCDFEAGVNPVLAEAIMRLDLDLSP